MEKAESRLSKPQRNWPVDFKRREAARKFQKLGIERAFAPKEGLHVLSPFDALTLAQGGPGTKCLGSSLDILESKNHDTTRRAWFVRC
jgi:hypothetical protein